jgi:hypothetical protein
LRFRTGAFFGNYRPIIIAAGGTGGILKNGETYYTGDERGTRPMTHEQIVAAWMLNVILKNRAVLRMTYPELNAGSGSLPAVSGGL